MADLTVALVLKAVDRLSGPLKRVSRSVGQLAREAGRSAREMRRAGAASRRMAEDERRVRRETERATKAVQRQAEALKRLARMREQAARRMRERGLALAGKLATGGAAATAGAYGIRRLVEGPVDALRRVEQAKGELATLGVKNMRAWLDAAREAQRRIAGMWAADFLRAGYDIKSALSNLTDEAAASMTTAVAWTAKATKASAEEMAPLFAAAYGTFKRQFKSMSDAQFGNMTAGMVAAAVRAFKTTGSAMRQALQSAGPGAANAGMGMAQQFAVLGMMQQVMEPGMAGTALKAYAAKAAEAEQRFRKKKLRIRLLDKHGMLRDVADVLADMRKAFGKVLDAREKAVIQKAFGSEEAVRLIEVLWGQEKALRANAEAMRKAAAGGRQTAITMAMLGQRNLDARLALLAQKWDLLKQQLGEAFAPALNWLIPKVAALIDGISQWLKANPKLAATVGGVVIGLGALLAVIGPLMMGLASLVGTVTMAAFAFRLFRAASLRGMAAEILNVGAAMSSVARKRWRLPRLMWRAAIAPLRWAAFIPRLAWRGFVPALRWGAGLISRIPWLAVAGRLSWGALIRPLSWVALRAIPVIGWAALAGELIWDLLIKPLGWDKYIWQGLDAAWNWVRARTTAAWEAAKAALGQIDWSRVALFGLPGAVAEIVRVFTGIDLGAIGRRIIDSLLAGMQAAWATVKSWASGAASWLRGIWDGIRSGAAKLGAALAGTRRTPAGGDAMSEAAAGLAPAQKKASGGWMRPGLPTLVGERGPELIFPSRAGWVASNDNLRRLLRRAHEVRRQASRAAAAAAVATPLVSLPAAAQPLAVPAAAPQQAAVAASTPAAPQVNVRITINVSGPADARDIAREVDAALRRASRSYLADIENGGVA